VQAEHRVHPGVLHDAVGNHRLRARGTFPGRRAFLGRLEDELHRARQPILQLREYVRCREQDRHVRVMSAGVHDTDRLPFVLARRLAGKRHVGLFAHGQAVHVGPQRDDGTRAPAREHRNDPGSPDAGLGLEPEAAQALGDEPGGFGFAVRQLGMLMEVAAPLDHLRLGCRGEAVDVGAKRRGCGGRTLCLQRNAADCGTQHEAERSPVEHSGLYRVGHHLIASPGLPAAACSRGGSA
jgi:hypothetical protein